MENASPLHEVLYVSTLSPDSPVKVVSQIAAKARLANEASGTTGLLVFDGMRFCQQIEGPRKAVLALTERILLDPRHVNVEILHHGPLRERRFRRFSPGYVVTDDVDVLGRMQEAGPEQAMAQFLALLPSIDLDS
ncbi:MAG: BLUF domain-containing protein [Pseudomonadota bacterium]|uniref:BLUF domain-containing protein n=1 Tax=Polaromonas sp. TaxID=1869339 RepID=UPI0017E1CED5|nr:BLUF domain-containing protein [Polaromonas sp.]MBA3594610.1 BLUF domain-containing protein [Polaromonas sp.]MDQ3273203.1 BLUF domain-containing protein [Pseudomonadota bacterium]